MAIFYERFIEMFDNRIEKWASVWMKNWNLCLNENLKSLFEWRFEDSVWMKNRSLCLNEKLKPLFERKSEASVWMKNWSPFFQSCCQTFQQTSRKIEPLIRVRSISICLLRKSREVMTRKLISWMTCYANTFVIFLWGYPLMSGVSRAMFYRHFNKLFCTWACWAAQ